jgi:hypothetical protein
MVAEKDGDVDMSHEEDTKGRLARAQSVPSVVEE